VQHLAPPVTLPSRDPSAPPIRARFGRNASALLCGAGLEGGSHLSGGLSWDDVSGAYQAASASLFPRSVSGKFEVILFTASQIHANELLNRIDPGACIETDLQLLVSIDLYLSFIGLIPSHFYLSIL
jgi:hypothetical protein